MKVLNKIKDMVHFHIIVESKLKNIFELRI